MDGDPLSLTLRFNGIARNARAAVTTIDMLRGSALPAWQSMGSPEFPTGAEIQKLRDAAVLPGAEKRAL